MLSHPPINLLLALTVSISSLGLEALSQTPAQNPSDERAASMLRSPYLIEWFIDMNENVDLKQIWRLLKIELSADMSYRCKGDCEAETFDIEEKLDFQDTRFTDPIQSRNAYLNR